MPYEDSQVVGYLRQAHDTPRLTSARNISSDWP